LGEGFIVLWGVLLYLDEGFLLNHEFYCITGDYFVSWESSIGFYFIMGVTLYLGCLFGSFYCILGFMWVLGVVGM
jgi:hypothetical protein